MYTSKFFSTTERSAGTLFTQKKKGGQLTEHLYSKIVNYANKNNLSIVKVSDIEDNQFGIGVGVIFKEL